MRALTRAWVVLLVVMFTGEAASQGAPLGLKVDRALLPLAGAAKQNIRILKEKLKISEQPRLRALLGIQLLGAGDRAAALPNCRKAVKAAVTLEPYYCMALYHFQGDDFKEARRFLMLARQRAPRHPASYLLEAYMAFEDQDRAGVLKALEAGLRKDRPEDAHYWEWELLRLLERLGDTAGALQAAGKLLRLKPEDPRVYHATALLQARQGLIPAAIGMEMVCLKKAPWHWEAARQLLRLMERDGQIEAAVDLADRLLLEPHLQPNLAELRKLRSRLVKTHVLLQIEALERRAGLRIQEDDIRQTDPGHAAALLHDAGKVYLGAGDVDRALDMLSWAERLAPLNPAVLITLGEAQIGAGRFKAALETLKRAGKYGPNARRHLLLAGLASRQSRTKACLEQTRKGLSIQPVDVPLLLLRARCLFDAGRGEDGLKTLERLLSVDPRNRTAQNLSVDWYARTEPERALSLLESIQSQSPWDFRIARLGARLARQEKQRSREAGWLQILIRRLPPRHQAERMTAARRLADLFKAERRLKKDRLADYLRLCDEGYYPICSAARSLGEPSSSAVAKTPKRPGPQPVARPLKAPPKPSSRPAGKVGELERLGPGGRDFLVLGLAARGFEKLPKEKRIFLFYLARAAIAGDELLYIQNHRHALPIKRLLETLYRNRKLLDKRTSAGVHEYLKYVWLNHGPYDHRSGRKIRPRNLNRRQLREAVKTLLDKGERLSFLPGTTAEEKLKPLEPVLFESKFEPRLTVVEKGIDTIAASAVNLYAPQVTRDLLQKLAPKWLNRLNVYFGWDPVNKRIVPEIMNVSWRHGVYIERIIHFLRLAQPLADKGPQQDSIESLIQFYETGDEEMYRRHAIQWLKTRSTTDFLNGFIEQLKDPRGTIGQFEGMAGFLADSVRVGRLADNAAYFEERMPWPEEYRRKKVRRPESNIVDVLVGTGDMGPIPWAGYNLPNYADIRAEVGSKNVIFRNIMSAGSQKDREKMITAFYLPEYQGDIRRWGKEIRNWIVYMHEVIGHGSGCPAPGLKGDPRNLIGRSFGALEEARADLVALYFMADPKLVEIGAFPGKDHPTILKTAYVQYFQGLLASYHRFQGKTIGSTHYRGRQLIFRYLLEGGLDGKRDFGIEVVRQRGQHFVRIKDVWKVRKGLADLLGRIQTLKSTGDKKTGELLVDRFGTSYNKAWKRDVDRRAKKIKLARQSAFVYPHLVPVLDDKGNLTDVKIKNDEDLTIQQLRFSRLQTGLDLD